MTSCLPVTTTTACAFVDWMLRLQWLCLLEYSPTAHTYPCFSLIVRTPTGRSESRQANAVKAALSLVEGSAPSRQVQEKCWPECGLVGNPPSSYRITPCKVHYRPFSKHLKTINHLCTISFNGSSTLRGITWFNFAQSKRREVWGWANSDCVAKGLN